MEQWEYTAKVCDMVFAALEKPKQGFYGPDECEREDCPDRKDELCPFGEAFPRCPYGRDWDK